MKFNKMGNSGLLLSEIALGTMIFGEKDSRGSDKKTAINIIHHYLDQGGNHIDTANVYAEGRSEEIVGKALNLIFYRVLKTVSAVSRLTM